MSTEFRSIKVRVGNAAQSIAIQEFLFTQGCRWNFDGHAVQHTSSKYLFVEATGSIGYDNSDRFFEESTSYKEMIFTFEDKVTVKSGKLKERPKTVLFGKTYFTDELESRLAGLEVANGRS